VCSYTVDCSLAIDCSLSMDYSLARGARAVLEQLLKEEQELMLE
jgi:hypothetical protein